MNWSIRSRDDSATGNTTPKPRFWSTRFVTFTAQMVMMVFAATLTKKWLEVIYFCQDSFLWLTSVETSFTCTNKPPACSPRYILPWHTHILWRNHIPRHNLGLKKGLNIFWQINIIFIFFTKSITTSCGNIVYARNIALALEAESSYEIGFPRATKSNIF